MSDGDTYAWTAPTAAEMTEIVNDLIWVKFDDDDTTWEAYKEFIDTENGNTDKTDMFSSRAMTFGWNTNFLPGWPLEPAFVKKWSGMCMEDYSSGMGGFCVYETNATNTAEAVNGAVAIYGTTDADADGEPDTDNVIGQDTSKSVETVRLSKTEFESFATAWTDMTYIETTDTTFTQDGRCYYTYLATLGIKNVAVGARDMLDYAYCNATEDSNSWTTFWTCQMFMPLRDQQIDGYSRMDIPGVITYSIFNSYIPDTEELSLIQLSAMSPGSSAGADSVTAFAAIAVAAIAAMFF